jgi:hypothetical protein
MRNLEQTYVVRLFSEFEGILQQRLSELRRSARVPWNAEDLINGVATRERIADPVRGRAHLVREFRNAVVHPRATPVRDMDFQEAMSALNHFLVLLRDPRPPRTR